MPEQEKDVQFYSAAVNAWFGTQLEHDRSLLTLSAGGIGLLVTLLSTIGVKSPETVVLYVAALMSFLTCLGAVLWIFKRNAKHLEDIVENNVARDPLLGALDSIAIGSFFVSVVLSAIIGVSAAIQSLQPREASMSKDQNKQDTNLNESFNAATNMRPDQDVLSKSFNGAINMRPAPARPAPQTTATQQPSSSAPVSQQGNDEK